MKQTAEELISSMGWNYENTETSARFVAEHCVKNFYTEEDMKKAFEWGIAHITFEEWLEQFKKK